jgi:tetratricopeptide (TPR) repeat protein
MPPAAWRIRRAAGRALAVVPILLLAGACASLAERSPAQPDAAPAPAPAPEASEPAPRALPGVALSPDLVYDILLADIARQRGHLNVSLESLLRAARESRDPRLVERVLHVAVQAKRDDTALEAARLWVAVEPDQPDPHETLGALLLKEGDAESARASFDKALDLYGEDLAGAYEQLAGLLARQPDRAAAVAMMAHLVSRHADSADAHFELARLAARARDIDRGLQALDRALELRKGWEKAAVFTMHLLALAERTQQSDEFSRSFLDDHPRANELRIAFARQLLDRKENELAREQFELALKYNPDDADAAFAVGLLALDAKDYEQAAAFLERHLEKKPGNDQARLYLGQVETERGRFGEAVKWFESVSDPELRYEADMRKAVTIAKSGTVDAALSGLASVTPAGEKQLVQLTLTREQILREAKRTTEALQVMNNAIVELPDSTDLLYARALLAAQMNMLNLHEQDIRRVLEREPENAHALNALGYTLADQTDRLEEALSLIEQALALKPDDPFVLDSMGWIQYRLGNHGEAIRYLQRAFDQRNDPEIAAHLGEVLWVTGEESAARSLWRRAMDESPDNEVLRETIQRFEQ